MTRVLTWLTLLCACTWAWDISGTSEEASANIRAYLHLKLGPESAWQHDPDLIKEFSQDALKPYGFMDAHVHVDPQHKQIIITEGPPSVFKNINIELSQDCVGVHTLHPKLIGHIFRNDLYTQLKDALLLQAHQLGYFDAKVSGQVHIEHHEAQVHLNMECAHIYHLKEIKVDTPFSDELYLLHAQKLLGSPVGTQQLGAFSAAIRQRPELGQNEIIDHIDPQSKTVSWSIVNHHIPEDYRSIGIGFVSGKGADLLMKYQTVFPPKAHTLNLLSHFSSQNIDGQLVYTLPSRVFLDGTHNVRIFHEIFPNRRFNQVSRSELSYRLSRMTSEAHTDYGLSLQYNQDEPEDEVVSSYALYPYVQQERTWELQRGLLQVGWLLKSSTRSLGSQFDFISGDIHLNHRHLWHKRLLTKTQLSFAGIAHSSDVQDSWLYRTGGPTTVSGYPVDCIGPGNYLSVARLGIFYPMNDTWHVGYWATTGTASNELFGDLYFGQAIAADMQTPMGAIEFSIAKAPSHSLQFALTLLPL